MSEFELSSPLLTRIEASKVLRVSPRTIDTLMAQNAIPVVVIGKRCIRFQLAEIEKYLTLNTKNKSEDK